MKRFTAIFIAAFLAAFWACPALANPVTGPCADCHTMHNSQDNQSMDKDGAGPNRNLLKTDCLGCHSSNDGSEAVSPIGAPVVFNRAAPTFGNKYKSGPNQGLAGGNFYFVEYVDDNRGHNVMLGNPDDVLERAPNNDVVSCESTTGGCHWNLNEVYTGGTKPAYTGVQGCTKCHMMAANDDSPYPNKWHHHPQATGRYAGPYWSDDPHGWVANFYRHLGAPHIGRRNLGIVGYEDPDWELTVSANDHNDYREAYSTDGYVQSKSVSGFCAGCHQAFCNAAPSGTDGEFHKHPAMGVVIPDSGEYANAFGASHIYDPLIPVGQAIPAQYPGDMAPKATVTLGVDRVMCLSCHRAHGSPYPDMLRFDPNDMSAGGGAGDGEGCFKCHTAKDGS